MGERICRVQRSSPCSPFTTLYVCDSHHIVSVLPHTKGRQISIIGECFGKSRPRNSGMPPQDCLYIATLCVIVLLPARHLPGGKLKPNSGQSGNPIAQVSLGVNPGGNCSFVACTPGNPMLYRAPVATPFLVRSPFRWSLLPIPARWQMHHAQMHVQAIV